MDHFLLLLAVLYGVPAVMASAVYGVPEKQLHFTLLWPLYGLRWLLNRLG
jgi:hypothetical protein